MSGISTSRHHADWLSLVEVSGPFVSLPVLLRVFPQGLEPRDPAQAKLLRDAFEEWQDNPTAPGLQRAWILHVLTAGLGYPAAQITEGQSLPVGLEASMAEMGETLRPEFALVGPAGSDTADKAQLLISTYPAEQKLDRPVVGKHWKATPATRMMELLHGAGVPLGLVTNGEHWMLVYAPRGETTGYASWYASLWLDEPITLRAFRSLMGVRRFFGVADTETLLGMLKESAQDQQEVTDQLGYQVRKAVEVLVQSFDALDKDSGRNLLHGVAETALYEAALTIMMRLIFLFSAEERGLLHLGKPLYDDNYAVSTLQEQLQDIADRHGEEVLERGIDAWARLLATFRAVHGGIQHQDLLLQAYGGSLFDPDRYPFLEGRPAGTAWRTTPAKLLAVNNRVVLHLLSSLQRLRIKDGSGGAAETRRISFRALGVEQIGHVYEGLLDHTGVRANEPVLGVKGTSSKEPVILLATLETLSAQGQDKLVEFLKEETGRSVSALRKALQEDSLLDEHKLLIACDRDETLFARLRPFAGLIREDSFERPLVVLPGSVYVTVGSARRSTGTHYTPPSLTEPIVQYTLEPLVYEGPAEGWPREQWKLKPPSAILALKVCDMAMGSGAFLVQVCRYLAERLVEAWENEEKLHPGEVLITPEGKFSEGSPSERLVPAEADERIAIARRVIADRCLYGVDINPMAVEMAKLSLWLLTLDAKRPFTFLDHAFKCGDSLLGLSSFKQLENFSLRSKVGKQIAFSTMNLWRHVEDAKKRREELEIMASDTPEQIAAKEALYADAEGAVATLKSAADVLVALEFKAIGARTYDAERESTADQIMAHWSQGPAELDSYAEGEIDGRRTLHWPLAFPEITERGGFDAFVGNPPFLGGRNITSIHGKRYNDSLLEMFDSPGTSADLCSYFLKRSWQMLRHSGTAGFVTVETIASGKTWLNGLSSLCSEGGIIFRARTAVPWPGDPNREVAIVHFTDVYRGKAFLNEAEVTAITSSLRPVSTFDWAPKRLKTNLGIGFQGITVNGNGFILSASKASEVCLHEPRYKLVLSPYLTGVDLNRLIVPTPTQFVINFHGMSEEQAAQYPLLYRHLTETIREQRIGVTSRKDVQEKWWSLQRVAPELEAAMAGKERVLARTRYGANHCLTFVLPSCLFSDGVLVFAFSEYRYFAILQSDIHFIWALEYGSPRAGGLRYKIKPCFESFPFPDRLTEDLDVIGENYFQNRQCVMERRQEGINDIYNRFHDPQETGDDIRTLRDLHIAMDAATASCYGLGNCDLAHGFYETHQGIRYTISERARGEVLDRLLTLNHARHDEEETERTVRVLAAPAKRARKKVEISGQEAMSFDLEQI
jgi:hypothetical protein